MRRTLAVLVLLAVAVISFGCSNTDSGASRDNTTGNGTGTTTYSNTAPSGGAMPTGAAPSQGNNNSASDPRIKPPTDK